MKNWNLNRKYLILFKKMPEPAERFVDSGVFIPGYPVRSYIGYCLQLTDKTENICNKNR